MKKWVGICLIIFPITVYCSDLFSPLVKIGVNINRMEHQEPTETNKYFDYVYHPGFIIGISNETMILKKFYINNSLYWQYTKSQMSHIPAAGYIPIDIFKFNSLRFSMLLGFKIYDIIDLLMGVDFGRLTKLNIKVYEHDWSNGWNYVPDNFLKFDTALCFGLGKGFRIFQQEFKVELKYLYGLTEYIYFSDNLGSLPGPTRNHNLQLELGYRLF